MPISRFGTTPPTDAAGRPSPSVHRSVPQPGRLPRIAVLGLRGIPASWGGVERQCEELYTRLAAAGFPVTLYCRSTYVPSDRTTYRGVRLVRLFAPRGKHLEAFAHTLLCCLHLAFHPCDIVHVYSQGPSLFIPLIRLLSPNSRVFFTCGGLDWQRRKWSPLASIIIRAGEWCSARFTHTRVMVSAALAQYYQERYGVASRVIPNGVSLPQHQPLEGELAAMGIAPRHYALFIGRLVPEKRIEDLIAAFKATPCGMKLVVAGGAAGSEDYAKDLLAAAADDENIIFTGYRFGAELAALLTNARAYVTASELEGLPLSLLEGMAAGLPCLASDIAPHRELLEETGEYFPVGDVAALGQCLRRVAEASNEDLTARGTACRDRATQAFSWDTAAQQLAEAYRDAMA